MTNIYHEDQDIQSYALNLLADPAMIVTLDDFQNSDDIELGRLAKQIFGILQNQGIDLNQRLQDHYPEEKAEALYS